LDFLENRDFQLTEDSIGSIFCSKQNIFRNISSPELIKIGYNVTDLFELNNGNILIGSYYDNVLGVYDAEFKLIRKKDKIFGQQLIQPAGLVCHTDGSVFMTNSGLFKSDDTLNKLDGNLQLIKTFKHPHTTERYGDLCIYENKLFVCSTKSIDVFTLDLMPIISYMFEHEPILLRIMNNVACVSVAISDEKRQNCFFRLPSFELIAKHEQTGSIGSILAHDNLFYIVTGGAYSVYSQHGKLI
jgi:hypothetical protein